MDIQQLNSQFALPGHASVIDFQGLPAVQVRNASASAIISFLGAHVCSYIPNGEKEMLYLSPKTPFAVGQSIRGGIPICWPWFGKHPEDDSLPLHGLGRIVLWNLDSISALNPSTTIVQFSLDDSPEFRKNWDHPFHAVVTFTIGDRNLQFSLQTTNTGSTPFTITQAFHTYFRVADITRVAIDGFDGKSCLNKVPGAGDFTQQGTIRFSGEFDSVFHDVSGDATLHDEAENRTVIVSKANSNTGVVWNPWGERIKRFPDFPPEDYRFFVCIEATNALEDARVCQPGQSIRLDNSFRLV